MVTKMELWELDEQGYHLVVKGRVNGQPARFLLDTGANHICFDRQFVEETLQEQSSVVGHDEINVGIGGNDFETSIIHISGLKIGRMKFKEMDVRVLDLSAVSEMYQSVGFKPIQGILGGDFLRQYQAVINYQTLELTLKK